MKKLARRIVEELSVALRKEFDSNLAPELEVLYESLDSAIESESQQDPRLLDWPKELRQQKAVALALLAKTLNDIVGALELLRTGHADLCQGTMRSAVEAFATAVLVDTDSSISQRYMSGKFETHHSLELLLKRNTYDREARKQYRRVYQRLNKLTHPTVLALATKIPSQGGWLVGGAFHEEKMPLYRSLISEMSVLAGEVSGYVSRHHPKDRPQ